MQFQARSAKGASRLASTSARVPNSQSVAEVAGVAGSVAFMTDVPVVRRLPSEIPGATISRADRLPTLLTFLLVVRVSAVDRLSPVDHRDHWNDLGNDRPSASLKWRTIAAR